MIANNQKSTLIILFILVENSFLIKTTCMKYVTEFLNQELVEQYLSEIKKITTRSWKIMEVSEECIAGLILKGIKKPKECPQFGKKCKPEFPLGAPMVSSVGACAAYYHFHQTMEDLEAVS